MCREKCPLCGKEMNDYLLYKHFRNKCPGKDTMQMYEFTCLIYGREFVDSLIQQYKNGVAMFDIERSTVRKTLSNIPSSAWHQIFEELHIKERSLDESARSTVCRNKYRTTCENKYGDGIINVSQSQQIKDKKCETFIKHYGVDNIWKSQEFKEWINDYMVEKYGKKRLSGWDYANQQERDEINKKRFDTIVKHGQYNSCLEERIQRILIENSIPHQRCFWIYHHPYDFIIGDHIYLLLEINGDYWHANPNIYKPTDVFKGGRTAQDIWDRDKKFKDCLNGSKFSVVYLWESEICNMSDQEILDWINEQIRIKTIDLVSEK